MKTESRWYSETARAWIAEGKAEGRAEGETKILLRILQSRGIEIAEERQRRITECRDPEQIETWGDRALTATSANELFNWLDGCERLLRPGLCGSGRWSGMGM